MDPISLKCSNHNSSLISSLDLFKAVDSFVDVTLVCEGHTVKAHKIILSAGSNVLHRLLLANPATHPILIFSETKYDTLRLIIDFLYKGRVDIPRNDLRKVLQVATTFEINDLRKLCEESLNNKNGDNEPNMHPCLRSPVLRGSSPKKKRQRRQSFDSDILIHHIVPKTEINLSPCRSKQPEVSPFADSLSVIAETELVEFHPQISDSSIVHITSKESSTGCDLTGSSVLQIQKHASTECDIQLQKEVKSKCVPIKPARVLMKPTYSEIIDCVIVDSSETSSQDLTNQTPPGDVSMDSLSTIPLRETTKDNNNHTNRLLQSIEKSLTEMMDVNKKVETVLSKFTRLDCPVALPELLPEPPGMQLPIDCDDDLIELNNQLQDTQLLTTWIRYLHQAGSGKSLSRYLSSIVKKLLSQKVALLYSRLGRKGKKCFMKLEQVLKAILTAASLKFPEVSEEELAVVFGRALAGAVDWEGRNSASLGQIKKNNVE